MIIHFAMEEGILNIALEQTVCFVREEDAIQFVSNKMYIYIYTRLPITVVVQFKA
jgi:hypothetical protein